MGGPFFACSRIMADKTTLASYNKKELRKAQHFCVIKMWLLTSINNKEDSFSKVSIHRITVVLKPRCSSRMLVATPAQLNDAHQHKSEPLIQLNSKASERVLGRANKVV